MLKFPATSVKNSLPSSTATRAPSAGTVGGVPRSTSLLTLPVSVAPTMAPDRPLAHPNRRKATLTIGT